MEGIVTEKKKSFFEAFLFVCVFLACMMPRYISTFKLHVGIDISLFTMAVIFTWVWYVRKIKVYRHIESWFFVLWFVYVVVQVWRVVKVGVWGAYVDWTFTTILFIQLLYYGDRKRVFECAFRAMLCGWVLHLLIGLYEITAHRYVFGVGEFSARYYGVTPVSVFHNPNDYATFVVTVMPIAAGVLIRSRRKLSNPVLVILMGIAVVLVLRGESRAGFLTMLLFLAGIVYLYWRKSAKNKVITFLGVVAALAVCLTVAPVRQYIVNILQNNSIDAESGTDTARLNLIRNGLYFLKETHGFGVGAGNLYYWLTEKSIYYIGGLAFIHNWYVELLVTFGVLFFAFYAFLHGKIIVKLVRGYRKDEGFFNLNNTLLISFVGFTLMSISSSSNIYSEWVWMYLALSATFCMYNSRKEWGSDL